MKLKEFLEMSDDDLRTKEKNLRKEIFELNYLKRTGRVDKPSRFKIIRRDIARILTILNERARDGKKS